MVIQKKSSFRKNGLKSELPLLQQRTVLSRYFCRLLGFDNFNQLREQLKEQAEIWSEDGHSYFYKVLEGRQGLRIPIDRLSNYDLRIRDYVRKLSRHRTTVNLKYYQYLAILFTEIYLDKLFNEKRQFVADLASFIRLENAKLPPNVVRYDEASETYFNKMAFWMATGSGKTFVMHVNLWQYAFYSNGKVDHDSILLITPNEGLSAQHFKQLKLSGIPAIRYGEPGGFQWGAKDVPVKIIEITKLTEKKKGGGSSVEIETFGSNNLLFVDEGHRGASGEVWRELRRQLAESSFTFEYSATFGQIVNGATSDKRSSLLEEYSKAIIFDYSYPHFYYDGFGKEYWIANLKDESASFSNLMLLGNLLSFWEQMLTYAEHQDELSDNNLEPPLWVFVGHSVTGGKTKEDKASLTDVEEIMVFFNDFLSNGKKWIALIEKILREGAGLESRFGQDIFEGQFLYLKDKNLEANAIYGYIINQVFGGKLGDTLRAIELKNADGEIGLKVGTSEYFFGVINIGDVSGLHKIIANHNIACEDDVISDSLFDHINDYNSTVKVLVGARKFMEGWDSFRVSSMGLLNIGKGEGSQIIQLFGRGIRLWGKGNSLKRSSSLEPDSQLPYLRLLETLNIFGVRANYMAQFREYLRQEGIETEFQEFPLAVMTEKTFLDRQLQIIDLPHERDFCKEEVLFLDLNDDVEVTLDLIPRFEIAVSGSQLSQVVQKVNGSDRSETIRDNLSLYDLDAIYFTLLEFKNSKGFCNIVFNKDTILRILKDANFKVLFSEGQFEVKQFKDVQKIQDIAIAVLQKYVTVFYDLKRRAWERNHLQLRSLSDLDKNVKFDYILRVKASDSDLVKQIASLIKKGNDIYKRDVQNFPNIHFDRHLYQPLITYDRSERIQSSPPGLNPGETSFVRDLRAYLQLPKNMLKGKEIYLLRNLSRGRGIGFFQTGVGEAFYPDFILWILSEKEQRIAFIDPHGMRHVAGLGDQKLHLHEQLKQLEPTLQKQSPQWKIQLTSFIIAPPPQSYEDLRQNSWLGDYPKKTFENTNVFFGADSDYIEKILTALLQ